MKALHYYERLYLQGNVPTLGRQNGLQESFLAKASIRSHIKNSAVNPLNPELNPICYLLALLGAHHFLHVSRIRVKFLTLRRLM